MFCSYYVLLGNEKEAAVRAGVREEKLEKTIGNMLAKESIQKEIEKNFAGYKLLKARLNSALERIAFSPVNDALLLMDPDFVFSKANLSRLDLFCLSGIKRGAGDAIELMFNDRLEALAIMLAEEQSASEESNAMSLYTAILNSAQKAPVTGAEANENE